MSVIRWEWQRAFLIRIDNFNNQNWRKLAIFWVVLPLTVKRWDPWKRAYTEWTWTPKLRYIRIAERAIGWFDIYPCHLPRPEVVMADFVVLAAALESDHVLLSAVFMYVYSVGCVSYHSCISQCYCGYFVFTIPKRSW